MDKAKEISALWSEIRPQIGELVRLCHEVESHYEVTADAYQRGYMQGLSDAWDAARKISMSKINGGLSWEVMNDIFSTASSSKIYKTFTASEAIEKIRQYEQEQEIKVWDEVQHKNCNSIKIIVLNKESGVITGIAIEDVPYACKVGDMYINCNAKDWEKTGKHYEIAEVLRKLREKES